MATIATASLAPVGDQRIILRGISWATYKRLTEELGDQSFRIAYNQGTLELMSPGPLHEDYKGRLRNVVDVVTDELGIPCKTMGSTLWEIADESRGLEPDECYYLTAEKIADLRIRSNDSAGYPRPDLAIEVDFRRSRGDRSEIYASLEIPEVWRFDGGTLRIDGLEPDGAYSARSESRFLPLKADEISPWILIDDVEDDNAWRRLFRAWVRAELANRWPRA